MGMGYGGEGLLLFFHLAVSRSHTPLEKVHACTSQ